MAPDPRPPAVAVGADVGGTFTDVVVAAGAGPLRRAKILSTPPDFERAVIRGLEQLLDESGRTAAEVTDVVHATTAATNAILELAGARTALLTTKGFRDVLELGRVRRPSLFDVTWRKPPPLAPRRLRLELDERVAADGTVLQTLAAEEMVAAARRLRDLAVESVAICFLNSFANPAHERLAEEILLRECPGVAVSASYAVLPEIREYERASTTTVNAYVRPLVGRYVGALRDRLRELGVGATLRIMQSNGGLLPADAAAERPVFMVESGPAAGVTAAVFAAARLGEPNVLAFDMGGTTAKATLIEDGAPFEAVDYEVGGEMTTNRLLRGGGYSVRTPSVDIAEVGAGGGSVFWLDRGGAPRVGPRSAGAVPGPACYGLGGERCTVTDANVVLGYVNPQEIAGGSQRIDAELAAAAVREQAAAPLGAGLLEAAFGVHALANASMGRALRSVSLERGRDPREFTLMAFGGAGPIHAAALARTFRIGRVIVPRSPGLFSALGLLAADVRRDFVSSVRRRRAAVEEVAAMLDGLAVEAEEALAGDGGHPTGARVERFLDLRYEGQSFELTIPLAAGPLTADAFRAARRRFDEEHERTYGHRVPDQEVEVVNVRLRATAADAGRVEALLRSLEGEEGEGGRGVAHREAHFGPDNGSARAPVVGRWAVGPDPAPGPLLVEEMDSTTVVPPDWTVRRDGHGNLVLEREAGA
jgi:N-methylhydantoinase A